jgi:hypothetical protein
MKKLIFLLPLLVACSPDPDGIVLANLEDAKFSAGDEVKTTVKFYANCRGVVTGMHQYKKRSERPYYTIDFYCQNTRAYGVILNETSLTRIE